VTSRPLPLLLAGFLISTLYYVITAILPIYLVESSAHGGLEWSRSAAFSLFGTYVAVASISPFAGGACADFFCGRKIIASCGYMLVFFGILFLPVCTDALSILIVILFIALGTGFAKVCLMSSVGTITATMDHNSRQKIYEHYYVGMAMGFVVGNFLANPLFDLFGIKGIVGAAIAGLAVSCLLGFRYFTPFIKKEPTTKESPPSTNTLLLVFGGLILLAVPFSLVSHQCHTSISLFVHQAVDRSLAGFTIPTLWFASFGSLAMVFFVPIHRRFWKKVERFIEMPEFVKMGVGFLLSCSGFACIALLAASQSSLHALSILTLLFANALFFIADIHVRPVLFSSATTYVPSKYHTLSTAVVYTANGLGGKLAGAFAGNVDTIGFTNTFLLCSIICLGCATLSTLLWRQSSRAQTTSTQQGEKTL